MTLLRFKEFIINEKDQTGQDAGQVDLQATGLKRAIQYAQKIFKGQLYDQLPNFNKNYLLLKHLDKKWGKTLRHEMPAIDDSQVDAFQRHLQNFNQIKTKTKQMQVQKLYPIQKQIYLDKILPALQKAGIEASRSFYSKSKIMVASQHRDVLDGHHRWAGGMLIDPHLTMATSLIHSSKGKLMPLAQAFTDRLGNKRNEAKHEGFLTFKQFCSLQE